eukprot:jgi/Mesen1/513/ME000104S10606
MARCPCGGSASCTCTVCTENKSTSIGMNPTSNSAALVKEAVSPAAIGAASIIATATKAAVAAVAAGGAPGGGTMITRTSVSVHPLDPLSPPEIEVAIATVRGAGA